VQAEVPENWGINVQAFSSNSTFGRAAFRERAPPSELSSSFVFPPGQALRHGCLGASLSATLSAQTRLSGRGVAACCLDNDGAEAHPPKLCIVSELKSGRWHRRQSAHSICNRSDQPPSDSPNSSCCQISSSGETDDLSARAVAKPHENHVA
jgi:hypothetical protein